MKKKTQTQPNPSNFTLQHVQPEPSSASNPDQKFTTRRSQPKNKTKIPHTTKASNEEQVKTRYESRQKKHKKKDN